MNEELPEGWVETRFSELITELRNGISTRPNLEPPGTPILRISATRPGVVALAERRYLPAGDSLLDSYGLREKDLLFTRYNGSIELLGVCGMVRGLNNSPLLYPDKLMRVRLREPVVPEFIEAYFQARSARQAIMALAKSSAGQQGISGSDLRDQSVRLAPLPEQHRIVEKVEALFEQVNRAKERLDRVPLILKRFRQAVLAAACSGQLGDAREAEVEGPLEFLSALPQGWRWMTAEEVCLRVVDCHNKTAPYTETGIRLLRTTNIRGGTLVLDDARYVSKETYKFWSKRCPPEPGDVLFTREAPMGEAALIPPGMQVCMGQRMMLLRANPQVLSPEYLLLAVQAPYVRKYAEHVAVGSGVLHMRVGDVERLPIPVPPIEEQAGLVTMARSALSFVDKIEVRVCRVAHTAEQLPQAILSKAFSGELVPTEAELARLEGRPYETAEELLKRVTALGSDALSTGTGRGRRTRKAE